MTFKIFDTRGAGEFPANIDVEDTRYLGTESVLFQLDDCHYSVYT